MCFCLLMSFSAFAPIFHSGLSDMVTRYIISSVCISEGFTWSETLTNLICMHYIHMHIVGH